MENKCSLFSYRPAPTRTRIKWLRNNKTADWRNEVVVQIKLALILLLFGFDERQMTNEDYEKRIVEYLYRYYVIYISILDPKIESTGKAWHI